jgi:chromosome segregation ATPase
LDEIRRIETMEGIMNRINEQEKKRNDLLQEQERLEAKLAALREKAASATGADTHLNSLLGDVEAKLREDRFVNNSSEEEIKQKLEELKQAYNMLNWEVANGTTEGIIAAAERYKSILDNYATYFGDDRASKAYNKVSALLEEEDALKAIKDAYGEAAAGQEEINNILKQIEDAEKRRIEIADTIARQQADALKAAQEEYLLKLRMTEAERELYDLRKAQEDFMGPAAHGVMGMGGGPMDAIMQQALEQQNEAARISFLEAQRAALVKDLEALVPEIIVKAGLEQSAMDAQAKAFDQMLQASAKKPDPQIERTNRLLESIDNAIKNGGRIEVIQ